MSLVSSCRLLAAPFLFSLLRVSLATVVLNSISASFADLPAKFGQFLPKFFLESSASSDLKQVFFDSGFFFFFVFLF